MTSAKLMPLASTRIRTSLGPGLGSSAARTASVSGGPTFVIHTWRMGTYLPLVPARARRRNRYRDPGPRGRVSPIEPPVSLLLRRDHQHSAGGVRAHMSRSVAQRDIEQPAFAVASDHQQVSLHFGCDFDDDVSGTAEAKNLRDGHSLAHEWCDILT